TGSLALVKILMDAGARADSADATGRKPVDIAMKEGHKRATEILAAADPNVTIQVAAYVGAVQTVKHLIEAGANVNLRDNESRTLLHLSAMAGHEDVVRLLLSRKARPQSKDQYGRTPLHAAGRNGHERVVRLLLASGARIDEKDRSGWTPLHEAACNGHSTVVETLVSKGANVNARTTEQVRTGGIWGPFWTSGVTPLFVATAYRKVTKILIAAGADVNAATDAGDKLIHQAIFHGDSTVVRLLLSNAANVDIHSAAYVGAIDKVKELIKDGTDANRRDRRNNTPLHHAVRGGHKDLVELLIARGADIDAKNEDGYTPLAEAAQLGYRDVAQLLLAKGADVNTRHERDLTPLIDAAHHGHAAIIELLLANGADVEVKSEEDMTALDAAVKSGFPEIAKLLGGDPDRLSAAENSPYTVIVSEPQTVREFLRFEGLEFEDVWIPDKDDLEGLEAALKTFLENNTSIRSRTWVDREFVLAKLRLYNREYSGFLRDESKYIICQLHLCWFPSHGPPVERFSIIFDGGSSIVRVIFEAESKEIVHIDCNGEA
ncbi:MAG: ankyrin repeat domain-containing protein, partial [Phycisphaerales bacterium]